MKLKFVNFFALFFTVTLLIAQPYSSELDSILQHRLDSLQLQIGYKGIGVAIQCSDGHIWTGSRGISSINPTVEVTNQDAYQIGSVTKTMTAACILQMEEESLLDLDDSISLYLDEYISGNAFIDPNITIRQLLRHESGLFDVFANASLQPTLMNQMDSVWLVPDIISTFLQAPLFDAGTSWSYSSTNYLLLSLIIEEISGQPYYAEMRERFFDPLELNSIVFPAYEAFNSPVAHVWINIFGGPATEDAHSFWTNYLSMNSAAGAAGAYYGTPHDINTWTWKLFRGDLFSAELLDQMTTTVNAPGLPNSTYGLGMMKRTFYGHTAFGHGGDLAYSASSWYFPEYDLSITALNNDSEFISWDLVPVIAEMLDAYIGQDCSTLIKVEEEANKVSEEVLLVYPNPVKETIMVKLPVELRNTFLDVQIVNTLGSQVFNKKCRVEQALAITLDEAITSGYYRLNIWSDGSQWSVPFMKE